MQVESASPVRFARVEGGAVADQTWGAGPARLVIVPPLAQNVELTWERPEYRALFSRLGRCAEVVPVRALVADGRRGEARRAVDRYEACMAELGVQPRDLLGG